MCAWACVCVVRMCVWDVHWGHVQPPSPHFLAVQKPMPQSRLHSYTCVMYSDCQHVFLSVCVDHLTYCFGSPLVLKISYSPVYA